MKPFSGETEKVKRDELDDVIDRCKMIEKTGLSREELHEKVKKATLCLNLAHVLADTCETLIMDCEAILRPFGATFQREDKQHFKQLAKALQDAKKCASRSCCGPYATPDAEDYAQECDWWYNIVRLIEDRTGDDELKTAQVLNWLVTMPSVLNMFEVKKRDFQHIKL